jgi:hypothetical protein
MKAAHQGKVAHTAAALLLCFAFAAVAAASHLLLFDRCFSEQIVGRQRALLSLDEIHGGRG